ncbi:uncharacterized protein [Trachinotus anak]|uniref:uncharacterized protein isoform X2 n=1 Tax=Trachinotus anak TaxID=443729 RepID=UPI0039F16B27
MAPVSVSSISRSSLSLTFLSSTSKTIWSRIMESFSVAKLQDCAFSRRSVRKLSKGSCCHCVRDRNTYLSSSSENNYHFTVLLLNQMFTPHMARAREHLSMVKTAKMELLRALISECLSAAAKKIFKIAERTIIEHEEEMSCSKWVVDSHRSLLDVAQSHSEVNPGEQHEGETEPSHLNIKNILPRWPAGLRL